MTRVVTSGLLLASVFAIAGQSPQGAAASSGVPRVTREVPDADVPAPAKVSLAVASTGNASLQVWSDYLSGQVPQIHAIGRDTSGAALDEIVVSPSTAPQGSPSVAFNGTNFFVVWEESGDLFGTRVAPSGAVLDGYGIPVAVSRAQALSTPAVASDGTGFLVSWTGAGSNADTVFVKRVTSAGTVLDGAGSVVGSAGQFGNLGGGPAVAYNGVSYLVVWSTASCPFCGTLLGARVARAGTVMDPGGFPISKDPSAIYHNEYGASVSAAGSQFVVAWTGERCAEAGSSCGDTFTTDVLAGRVTSAGAVLGTKNTTVAAGTRVTAGVAVASNGSTSLVVWQDLRTGAGDIYAARVNSAGEVLDAPGIRLSTNRAKDSGPAVARLGTGFTADWATGVDIAGSQIDSTGHALDVPAKILSAGHAAFQTTPDVASDGAKVISVWRESRPGAEDTIRVGQTFPDQAPFTGEGTVIASGFDLGDPAIVSTDQHQLVVWTQDEKIYGSLLSSGATLGQPFLVSPAGRYSFPRSPGVAWNGTEYLVTWSDDLFGNLDVFGARVDATGTVLDPHGITIASEPKDQDAPAVASDGRDFFVTWQDTRSGSGSDIYGTRVDAAGSVLDPAGRAVSRSAGDQSLPDVTWNGTGYVAVWQDARSRTTFDIYGTRLSASGTVSDPAGIVVSAAGNDQARPTVSRTGTDVLIVWEDRRGASSDLYGARLPASGALRDPAGLVIANSSTDEIDPSSAAMSSGRVAIGYERSASEAPYRNERVFSRSTSPK